jgi:hypothetical protein
VSKARTAAALRYAEAGGITGKVLLIPQAAIGAHVSDFTS